MNTHPQKKRAIKFYHNFLTSFNDDKSAKNHHIEIKQNSNYSLNIPLENQKNQT